MFIAPEFWLFTLVILLLYNLTRGWLQNLVLLLGSYVIYAYFDLRFAGVLLAATTVVFLIGLGLAPESRFRRFLLIVGVLFTVGVLGYFKYVNFFAATFAPGQPDSAPLVNVILPLGISFYSFRLLSYLLDVYNGRVAVSRSWIDLALYIAFFPQISAGPIERASTFLPRLRIARRLDAQALGDALIFILIGLFYKLAIADNLARSTDAAFQHIADLSGPDTLSAMLLFSIRLYADFAGYSALAIGVSRLFMLPAMDNFRQPYFSRSIVEFWSRWHISLSSWFRDYFFFPLSRFLTRVLGRRFSFPAQLFSVFVTMLLTGAWHGSSLTFLAWGALHGAYMLAQHLGGRFLHRAADPGRLRRWVGAAVGILVTQAAVTAAWVLFGVHTLDEAVVFFQRLLSPTYSLGRPLWVWQIVSPLIIIALFDLIQVRFKLATNFWRYPLVWRVTVLALMAVAIFILGDSTHVPFIYNGF